jgi:homoserine O-succinyltransferase/O-acetyltransferase
MQALEHELILRRPEPRSARRTVTVGLVNNMGDGALKVTERQFADLLGMSAAGGDVRLRLFALKRTPRSPSALEYIGARYEPASAVMDGRLDALIITGAQPRARRLSEEPYWEELVDLIDWAKEHTASTILSCLAAHAAVLHLDGVERRPLPEKCAGVFAFPAEQDHPFVGRRGLMRLTPHSRHNSLSRSDLELAGYCVLTSSPAHGVDAFTKSFGSQFVFLQGHPEYDANSLAREYRRDLARYLRGEADAPPVAPKGYFGPEAEAQLRGLERRAREDPRSLPTEILSQIEGWAPLEADWCRDAARFFRSWIETIAAWPPGVLPDFEKTNWREANQAERWDSPVTLCP